VSERKGLTVSTANGDYKVPLGRSWGSQMGPDGTVLVAVHAGPFKELNNPDTELDVPVSAATGDILGQFDEVEAVFFTEEVTVI
jgi:hypothetical protein